MKIYYCILLFGILSITGNAQISSYQFKIHNIDGNMDGSARSKVIDLDKDGDKDIVATALRDNQIVWFENDGDQNFEKHVLVANFIGAWEVKVGDFDNDGDIDIWASGYDLVDGNYIGREVVWFDNDGNQNFSPKSFLAEFGEDMLFPTDFNGDGLIDFVKGDIVHKNEYYYGYSDDELIWFENLGNQSFSQHSIDTDVNTVNVVQGYFDGDSYLDYIVKDTVTDQYYFLKNNDGQEFVSSEISITETDQTYVSDVIDFDRDGDKDLIAFAQDSMEVLWYENDGVQNFTRHTIDSSISYPYATSTMDFDADGDLDVFSSAWVGSDLAVYINDGNENFSKVFIDDNLVGSIDHFVVDLDDDFDYDIVANSFNDNGIVWYENQEDKNPYIFKNLSDENFVYQMMAQTEALSEAELIYEGDMIESVTYFDGLGRAKQSIGIQAGGDMQDLITHVEYDAFGRQEKEFLPYSETNNQGIFQNNPTALIEEFYKTKFPDDFINTLQADVNAYSEKHLEASPLSRVLEVAAPGEDWALHRQDDNDHSIKFDYSSNGLEEVKLFKVVFIDPANTEVPSLNQTGYYLENELFKTITKDENWQPGQTNDKDHTTEEFKDKAGRVILKRTYNNNELHDTYYVYDDFGNLTYVLPPKMDINAANDLAIIVGLLDDLAYQYAYDSRNRLIEKKIPGKGKEYIVYDNLDRPVLTQDAIQKTNFQWLFTKYDVFGRVCYTGIYSNEIRERDLIQSVEFDNKLANENFESKVNSGDTNEFDNTNYTKAIFPDVNLEVLTVNYYDDYNFVNSPIDPATQSESVFGQTITNEVRGLPTGSKIKVLDTNDWIYTATYYNKRAQAIYVYSENEFLNTIDEVKSDLDFVGKPDRIRSSHIKDTNDAIVTLDTYFYDHMGRLLKQVQCIGTDDLSNSCGNKGAEGVESDLLITQILNPYESTNLEASQSITLGPGFSATPAPGQSIKISITNNASTVQGSTIEMIAENSYDDLGQMINKKVGNSELSPLQSINYAYNVRGWLKSINAPANLGSALFAFQIDYNDGLNPLYNGNIAATNWKTASINDTNNPVSSSYDYTYDALNRIISGIDNTGNYNLDLVTYDKNGNITALKRQGHTDAAVTGFGTMDDLSYHFNGNQLHSVSDSSGKITGFNDGNTSDAIYDNGNDDYSYDVNGNLIMDVNKGITSILYNHLNLPTEIKFNNSNTQKINYTYDATGLKLRKVVNDGGNITTKDYTGTGYVYENNALQFISHPEGYITVNSGSFDYVYQYKDHLGSVRISYSDTDGNGTISQNEIVEESNYYPFGLTMHGFNTFVSSLGNSFAESYKFNGKELDESFEGLLNTYDFGARNYDPALGKWMNPDAMADSFRVLSPYNYAANNPVLVIDPDGNDISFKFNYEKDKDGIEVEDKDGNKNLIGVTMTVTGKVINTSGKKVNMNSAIFGITMGIQAAFKGDSKDGVKFNTVVNLTEAKSMDDVEDSDHVFAISNFDQDGIDRHVKKDATVTGAVNQYGGKVVNLNVDYFRGAWNTSILGLTGKFTAAHEFGHALNMRHVGGWRNMFNLMKQGSNGFKVTADQLNYIIDLSDKEINKGRNYEIIVRRNYSQGVSKRIKKPNRGKATPIIKY